MLRREVVAILVGQAIADGFIGWVLLQSSFDRYSPIWSLSAFKAWWTAVQPYPTFYPSIALIVLSAFGAIQSVAAMRYDGTGLPKWLRPCQASRIAFGVTLSLIGLVGFSFWVSCTSGPGGGCTELFTPFWPLIAPGVFVITTGLICLISAHRVARKSRPAAGTDISS